MEEEVGGMLVEEREELMVSAMGTSAPTLRKAHFLKPPQVSTFKPSRSTSLPQSSVLVPPVFNPALEPSDVYFTAWGYHKSDWEEWAKHLEPKYRGVWKQAGIYSAIIGSTSMCERDYELIMGLAEKWCPKTNSFVFPWGEATLTLEDVAILGGYSVLGSPVYSKSKVKEPAEVELAETMRELAKGRFNYVKKCDWIKEFKDSGRDIEHEAFLSLWLHPILFSNSSRRTSPHQFCLATQLAMGERLALAPAVLAGIYRDLSFLKSGSRRYLNSQIHFVQLWAYSQIHFVQLWAWERFPAFQPVRNRIEVGDPRSFMWDCVKPKKVFDVRLALDSAGETFCWRPYTLGIDGWQIPKFYRDKQGFQNLQFDEDLQAFALCLRASKLVGVECILNYFPQRVSLQFGLDQDVPSNIIVEEQSLDDAWTKNYMRPFEDTGMYIPSRLFKADVTVRYMEWWKKQAILLPPRFLDDVIHKVVRRKRTPMKRSKRTHVTAVIANANNSGDVSRSCSTNFHIINIEESNEDDEPVIEERVSAAKITSKNGRLCNKRCFYCWMKPTLGEVGESSRANGQIGTAPGMAHHVSAKKNDNPHHHQGNSKWTEGNDRRVCDVNIILNESDADDELEADRHLRDANTTSENNLSVADRNGRLHVKEVTRESANTIGHIGASAGTTSHLIAEKNAKQSDCQDNSNGTAQENGDNPNKAPEPEINARLARIERELAEIKSMIGSITQGK